MISFSYIWAVRKISSWLLESTALEANTLEMLPDRKMTAVHQLCSIDVKSLNSQLGQLKAIRKRYNWQQSYWFNERIRIGCLLELLIKSVVDYLNSFSTIPNVGKALHDESFFKLN